jgi:hypothetical protein
MQWSMKHQLLLQGWVALRRKHLFLLEPILEDLYVLIHAFIWDCLRLVWVVRAANHYLAVEHIR